MKPVDSQAVVDKIAQLRTRNRHIAEAVVAASRCSDMDEVRELREEREANDLAIDTLEQILPELRTLENRIMAKLAVHGAVLQRSGFDTSARQVA